MNYTKSFFLPIVLVAFAFVSARGDEADPGLSAARLFDRPLPGLERIGWVKAVPAARISGSRISIGFECLDRWMFDPARCYDRLADAGIKRARCQTGWSRCEQTKGVYDFTWLDDVVTNLLSRGVQPWFNVGFGNTNYMANTYTPAAVGNVPLAYGDECRTAWERYVRTLARRYRGRVREWEIWNEANIDSFWQPEKSNPARYLELIQWTGSIIREEIPDAKIGACISGVRNHFADTFIKKGGGKAIDFFSVHAYAIQPEDGFIRDMDYYRRRFAAEGSPRVELWQGESGFPSWFPPKHWLKPNPKVLVSQANQAKWMLRRFITDARAGCAVSSFFQMADMTSRPYSMARTTQTHPAEHGLLNGRTYEPKQAYATMGYYNAFFDDATRLQPACAWSLEDAGTNGLVTVGYLRYGRPLFVYYYAANVQIGYAGRTDVTVKSPIEMKEPVLVDLLRGGVYTIREVEPRDSVWILKRLPMTDYPLLITEKGVLSGRFTPENRVRRKR